MTQPSDKDRLDALSERLKEKRGTPDAAPQQAVTASDAQVGWRMVTELVTGLLLGFGIGYGLDWVLGTLPWMLIIFTGLGFVAGMRVMMRTAAEVQKDTAAANANAEPGKDEMYDDED